MAVGQVGWTRHLECRTPIRLLRLHDSACEARIRCIPRFVACSGNSRAGSARAIGALRPTRAWPGRPVDVNGFSRARARKVVRLNDEGSETAPMFSADEKLIAEIPAVERAGLVVVHGVDAPDG